MTVGGSRSEVLRRGHFIGPALLIVLLAAGTASGRPIPSCSITVIPAPAGVGSFIPNAINDGRQILQHSSGGVLLSDTLLVNPPTMGPLHVITDITLNGGNKTATVNRVENRFSEAAVAVPEPASLLLLGAGLAGYRLVTRRRSRS